MTTFEKTVQVNFSQKQMYNLVADVAAYPEFLPWCQRVEILDNQPDGKLVRIGLSHPPFPALSLTTRATFQPETMLQLQLVTGSFLSCFEGSWHFSPAPSSNGYAGCIVTFSVKYRFSNGLLRLTLSPFFSMMMRMLPERFIQRAREIY